MAAFFRATFDAWKDYRRSGSEQFYVGYSPIIGVDGDKILEDLPNAHVLHVVRNPWSAYADTKKRPVPLPLADYMLGWTLNQHYALMFERHVPRSFPRGPHRGPDGDPEGTLGASARSSGLALGDARHAELERAPLDEVYPWGTIRTPTPEANHATAQELSARSRTRSRRAAGSTSTSSATPTTSRSGVADHPR